MNVWHLFWIKINTIFLLTIVFVTNLKKLYINHKGNIMTKFSITLALLNMLAFSNVKSLNMFEFSLIGVGVGLVYDQYYDSSLSKENTYQNKVDVVSRFENSRQINVNKNYFDNLPIQQKLMIIETLNYN